MSIMYRALKATWRTVIPHRFSGYFFDGRTGLSKALLAIKSVLETKAAHDHVYDAAYYENYTDQMHQSAVVIADTIVETFQPRSVIDIGCGFGEVLNQFALRGVDAKGADLSTAALEKCKSRGLTVRRLDLENPVDIPDWRADVVISTEVAEHLPERFADHYVSVLCALSARAVVMTGAPPGQGGTDHVNEQPYSYWIGKFEQVGMTYSSDITEYLRFEWSKRDVEWTRARNVMVFTK